MHFPVHGKRTGNTQGMHGECTGGGVCMHSPCIPLHIPVHPNQNAPAHGKRIHTALCIPHVFPMRSPVGEFGNPLGVSFSCFFFLDAQATTAKYPTEFKHWVGIYDHSCDTVHVEST